MVLIVLRRACPWLVGWELLASRSGRSVLPVGHLEIRVRASILRTNGVCPTWLKYG